MCHGLTNLLVVRVDHLLLLHHNITIQEIKSIEDKPPITRVQKKQLSHVCVCVCWQRGDDRDFRSGGFSAKQNNMLERATGFVDLCNWICGTRWEVDFWRARLHLSLSAGFWQIIGRWFLGGAHKTQRAQISDYMQPPALPVAWARR